MQIACERNAVPRPVSVMSAPEIPVADFQLTEEELAKPLEGRVRRRPFSRSGPENPPHDASPESRSSDRRMQTAADAPSGADAAAPQGDESRPEQPTRGKPRRERKRRHHEDREDQASQGPEAASVLAPPTAEVHSEPPVIAEPAEADDSFAEGLE